MPPVPPLSALQSLRRCDPATLGFATTAEITPSNGTFGQARADEAIRYGITHRAPGYNIFVLGPAGLGRYSAVRRLLKLQAATDPRPCDLCYVNNFDDANRPLSLRLPAGRGAVLKRDMMRFADELGPAIDAALESDGHRSRMESLQETFKERQEAALRDLAHDASLAGIGLLRTPQGFAFVPVDKNGEPLRHEKFENLPQARQDDLSRSIEDFGERLHKLLQEFPRWQRDFHAHIRQAGRDAVSLAVGHLIEELKAAWSDNAPVQDFLDRVEKDVIETGENLREQERAEGDTVSISMTGQISLQRYQVNLLVDNANLTAAPVIEEANPNHQNLVGRVEQLAHLGTLVTNFTLIRAGALHRACGGYLMLDALRVLTQPYAWEGLKRVLRTGQITIESLGQVFGYATTVALEPEAIPFDGKVVLVGERHIHYLLRELDPEFGALFKIAADFEDAVPRDEANIRHYAERLAILIRDAKLRPLDAPAVARMIEHSGRLAQDAERLSCDKRRTLDLMREADTIAAAAGRAIITREDIDLAQKAQIHRAERLKNEIQRHVLRGIQMIATSGVQAGQINGLSVVDLGDFAFGHPVRITATARVGEGEVIDIERETELGGPLHSKGVLILGSFLATRYSHNLPLSLSASLVFEQSYGEVEGDSASLAELCALLSALSGAPIKQSLAVTGSVNQHGRVQAIGGVNEKIEGFFDLCAARGLNGEHGVILPESNVGHLMLREDVVEAIAQQKFHLYAVGDVDQAIELLTGINAGVPDAQGNAPADSINYRVASQMAKLAALRQAFASPKEKTRRKRGHPQGG